MMTAEHGTPIEWTHRPGTTGERWNPIRAVNKETGGRGHFCVHVSDGCKNCYAEHLQRRFRNPVRYARQDRDKVTLELDEKILTQPLRWTKPRTIFPCSMTDWMLEDHPDEWIDKMMAVMALTPQHVYMPLTKRAARQREYMYSIDNGDGTRLKGFRDALIEGMAQKIHHDRTGEDPSMWLAVNLPLPNVWLGVSVEDQKTADERIPLLLDTPAAVRWISAEPLLEEIDLTRVWALMPGGGLSLWDALKKPINGNRIDWVVAGGESDQNRPGRVIDLDAFRALRDQCLAAGVPFFMKQAPRKAEIPADLLVRQWPRLA